MPTIGPRSGNPSSFATDPDRERDQCPTEDKRPSKDSRAKLHDVRYRTHGQELKHLRGGNGHEQVDCLRAFFLKITRIGQTTDDSLNDLTKPLSGRITDCGADAT